MAVVAKSCVIKGYVIQVCSYTCDECDCRGITCESATGETGQLTACIKDTKEERETREHSVRIHDGLRQSSTGCSAVHGRCGWICEAQGRPAEQKMVRRYLRLVVPSADPQDDALDRIRHLLRAQRLVDGRTVHEEHGRALGRGVALLELLLRGDVPLRLRERAVEDEVAQEVPRVHGRVHLLERHPPIS